MITIKKIYDSTVIGFNNSGIALKNRSQDDLIDLAIMARKSGAPSLTKLFENLPSLDDLKQMKMKESLAKTKTQ